MYCLRFIVCAVYCVPDRLDMCHLANISDMLDVQVYVIAKRQLSTFSTPSSSK